MTKQIKKGLNMIMSVTMKKTHALKCPLYRQVTRK